MFSDRINRIQPSATLEMTAKAAELRSQGKDVINLSVGEPDFNTPQNIIKAAKKAMDSGFTKYTPGSGILDLRKAVCTKLKRDNLLNYEPTEVIVSCGGKHSLYNACQVLFQKNDEVIIFSPYWVSFPDFVSVTGAKPVFVKTDHNKQYEPDFDDLNSKITKNTKGIIINSPSNPTGGVWSNEAIKNTLKISKKHNLWVFSDECYEQLTYDSPFTSIATLTNDKNKILTFQSCSKTYAMTGWRIGYTAGNIDVIKAMSKLQGQSTSCPNSIAQYAAKEALIGEQSFVKKMREIFKKRRQLIVDGLNHIPNVFCDFPGGAFYAFPNIEYFINKNYNGKRIKSATDLSMLMLNELSIVTVAGNSFGSNNNIRLSYAASENDIKLALEKMNGLLSKIK
tara:strand:+ start:293 stop:1477 length:1185 start_codon:yes stop_codon:yes gene_type:complete